MATPTSPPLAPDIRAELARYRVKLYKVAARVGLHPTLLSRLLQERAPLAPDIARRIMDAIAQEARQTNSRNGAA